MVCVAVRLVRPVAADRPRVTSVPVSHGRPTTPTAMSTPRGLLQEHPTALLLPYVPRPQEGLPRVLQRSRRRGAQFGHGSRRLYPYLELDLSVGRVAFDNEMSGDMCDLGFT